MQVVLEDLVVVVMVILQLLVELERVVRVIMGEALLELLHMQEQVGAGLAVLVDLEVDLVLAMVVLVFKYQQHLEIQHQHLDQMVVV
jgi:hypothetical protein